MSKVVKGVFGGGDAAKDAGEAQAASSDKAVAEQRRQFDITQANLQPFIQAGQGALTEQQALLGLSGVGAQQDAFSRFTDSPGQAFLRERGERSLLQNQAAIGGLGGGNVRSELQQQGIGFAQQQLNNQLAQLGGISGTGSGTATNLGQIGANTASNIGANLQAGGQARASGILGEQQANAQLAQNAISAGAFLFSDERLKTNIVKIGNHSSGLGWYTWDWSEEGLKVAGDQETEGFIAQEVKKLYPAAVHDIGHLVIDYRRVV